MNVHVAIVGTGFAGLGAAIRLQQREITDVVLLERAEDLGGTWRDNQYPGCACDVPSRLYSFSFAQNPSWTRSYSAQPEIWAYLKQVAARHDVLPRIRFRHEVRGAQWDEAAQRWQVDTTGGVVTARVLVLATGALSDPALPRIAGLRDFSGPVFHSSQWRHDLSLSGKRVAVIGTGASAIQFVPAIQPVVAHLTVFQRTPPWVLPRRDRAVSAVERFVYRTVPGVQTMVRSAIYGARELMFLPFRHAGLRALPSGIARRHLEAQVHDPALRAALTPSYAMGCKRILVSDEYYPALTRGNVHLATASIERVSAEAVHTADGCVHPADVIILGTGFRATDPPLIPQVVGRGGHSLASAWSQTVGAYASTTVHGFPNLFLIPGPNSGLGHTSMIVMLEAQIAHLVHAVGHLARAGHATMEPRAEAQAAYMADVDRRMQGMVWLEGGCSSWYLDQRGRNRTLWPDFTWRFRRRVSPLVQSDYHFT